MTRTAARKKKRGGDKLAKKLSDKKFKKKSKLKKLDKSAAVSVPTHEEKPQPPSQPPQFPPQIQSTDSEPDLDSDDLLPLLESCSKDQLIEILYHASCNDSAVADLIRSVADRDITYRKVFVHGLGWDTTDETLRSAFETFGEIEDCNVVIDRKTGMAKGYGFVLFKTRKGAMKALKNPKIKINYRIVYCNLASEGRSPQSQESLSDRKIYVSKVPPNVDADKLRLFFAKFGKIAGGPFGLDDRTGNTKGYALFTYETVEGAKKALEEPYKMFEGHVLHCQPAIADKNKNVIQEVLGQGQAPDLATMPATTVLPEVAAAQNLALFGQIPSLNPLYNGLLGNYGAGLLATAATMNQAAISGALNPGVASPNQVGQMGSGVGGLASTGLSGYGGGLNGLGSLGPWPSSAFGSNVPLLQSLPSVYPAQVSKAQDPSPSGYTSY